MLTIKKRYHIKHRTKSTNTVHSEPLVWLPLSLRLFDRLIKITHEFDIYSDFVATNIWAYMGSEALVCFKDDGVAIRMIDDYDSKPYYTLISTKSSSELLTAIREHEATNQKIVLRHVPKETTSYLRKDPRVVEVVHDRNNHDYIYSVDKFIHFRTRKLKTRKKELESLYKKHPELEVRCSMQNDKKLISDMRSLYKVWVKQTNQNRWEKDYDALSRLVRQQQVPQIIVGIYDKDRMVGFTVNELIHRGYYMGFSGKANREYPGMSIALEHETAKIMKKTYGCKYLNLEQDLGIPGLRAFKLSLSPDRLLEKFEITVEDNLNVLES